LKISSFQRLIEKGNQLVDKTTTENTEFQGWPFLCLTTATAHFGDNSSEARAIHMNRQHFEHLISTLETLHEKLHYQSVPKNVPSTVRIELNIEHSDDLTDAQKAEAKKIL
jgi:hypothetical protein